LSNPPLVDVGEAAAGAGPVDGDEAGAFDAVEEPPATAAVGGLRTFRVPPNGVGVCGASCSAGSAACEVRPGGRLATTFGFWLQPKNAIAGMAMNNIKNFMLCALSIRYRIFTPRDCNRIQASLAAFMTQLLYARFLENTTQ
jgi:hypothetical protein